MRRRPHFVYRQFDGEGRLLYVGATRQPEQREREHSTRSVWWPLVDRTEYEMHVCKALAWAHEQHAIRTEAPLFNQVSSADRDSAHARLVGLYVGSAR